VEFLSRLKTEEAIIYIEGGAKVKGQSFSFGVLAEESALAGMQVFVFSFLGSRRTE
jgi:hypothetical protein